MQEAPDASSWLPAYGALGSVVARVAYRWRRTAPSRARSARAFDELMASQWWPIERIREQQWARVRRMLAHCYERVPYYRDMFEALHANPSDIRTPADLARLPLLTKEIIQREGSRLWATGDVDGAYLNYTGGSTGTPLSFRQDEEYLAWGMAELDRDVQMCGYRPGWRQAFLWGSDYDSKAHVGLRGFLSDLAVNLRWYNTFRLSVSDVRRIVRELAAFRPQLLVGYVSSLTMLATLAREAGLEVHSPHAIQTSAEVLTADARRLLEETMRSRCFDRYGCREVGNIAHECEAHDGLHLLMENNLTEFVPMGDGSTLQIVVTNLRNRAMPFVRYATGDTGVPYQGGCACGRGLARMKQLTGRVSDVIVAPSGRLIHGEFFTHLFYGATSVRQFQVEQTTQRDLIVRVVMLDMVDFESLKRHVSALILEHGDPAFRLDWRRVDAIDAAASGKYRFTLSHVPLPASQSGQYR